MFYENIKAPFASNNFVNPSLEYLDTKARVKFSGSCLNKNASTYNHRKSVNIYIVYETNKMATQQAVIQNYKIVYSEQLLWLKIPISISTNILGMVLDLLDVEVFHLVMELVEMK